MAWQQGTESPEVSKGDSWGLESVCMLLAGKLFWLGRKDAGL